MYWLDTDFNEIDDDGHLHARVPRVGELVAVMDGDGNQCRGRVVDQPVPQFLTVEPDWEEWEDGPAQLGGGVRPWQAQEALAKFEVPPDPCPSCGAEMDAHLNSFELCLRNLGALRESPVEVTSEQG